MVSRFGKSRQPAPTHGLRSAPPVRLEPLPEKKMKKTKRADEKIWFEVFKRDSFACQYCRRKAPDVLPEG